MNAEEETAMMLESLLDVFADRIRPAAHDVLLLALRDPDERLDRAERLIAYQKLLANTINAASEYLDGVASTTKPMPPLDYYATASAGVIFILTAAAILAWRDHDKEQDAALQELALVIMKRSRDLGIPMSLATGAGVLAGLVGRVPTKAQRIVMSGDIKVDVDGKKAP